MFMDQNNLYNLGWGLLRDHLYQVIFKLGQYVVVVFLFVFFFFWGVEGYKRILKCFLLVAIAARILHGMGIVEHF